MERVFSRKRTVLDRLCLPLERIIYRITGVDPDAEMPGKEYATCFVFFGFVGTLLLYGILRMQQFLPWFFPQYHTTPLSPDLALNTAISFSTTTTWQAYAGENTMSYFSQMVGLCAQNFLAGDRKSTRLNSSHQIISYAVFCLKKKKKKNESLV